jgi:hypothetical protein
LFSAHSAVSDSGNASQKIKFQRVSCFSPPKYDRQYHHVCHALHHEFTTKAPRSAHRFREIPLQTQHFTTPKNVSHFYPSNRIRLLSKTEGKRKLLGI